MEEGRLLSTPQPSCLILGGSVRGRPTQARGEGPSQRMPKFNRHLHGRRARHNQRQQDWRDPGQGSPQVDSSTQKIMTDPCGEAFRSPDATSAKFETTLDISAAEAPDDRGPFALLPETVPDEDTAQVWLLPGKHVTGDGIVIEVPGFVVDISAPQSPTWYGLPTGRRRSR